MIWVWQPVMRALDAIREFRSQLDTSTLYGRWRQANPGENQRIETYWRDRSRPATVATPVGKAVRAVIDAYHGLGG